MGKPKPIRQRIIDALDAAPGNTLEYRELALRVFPWDQFPRAWRHRAGGGPPGCFMALSSALRRHGDAFAMTFINGDIDREACTFTREFRESRNG